MPTSETDIQNSDGYRNGLHHQPEPRNWANLPWDVLSIIFKMIGALHIILGAETVCKEWWELAHQPHIWREVQFFVKDSYFYNVKGMALLSIRRSAGCLVEFFCMGRFGESLLNCIAESSPKVKRLGIDCAGVTEIALMEACEKLSLLEDLNISNFNMRADGIKSISNSCPNIKIFRFMRTPTIDNSVSNELAIGITKYMPHLKELLIGADRLDDKGVLSILKGCCQLTELHILECYNITYTNERMCRRLHHRMKYGVMNYHHVNMNFIEDGDDENDPILDHGDNNNEGENP